jgi:hypothetical protein
MFETEFLEKLSKTVSPEEAIGYLEKHIGERSVMDTEFRQGERTEMDTFGNLIDKLTTINSKLWHNQEELYKIRKMTPEEFVSVHGKDLKGLHCIVARCCDLNVQRAKLMDEIDKFLSFATNNKDIVREQHKIY